MTLVPPTAPPKLVVPPVLIASVRGVPSELTVWANATVPPPVLVSAAPVIQDPGARMQAVVAVFREISALKEASRLKDEFVSTISHDGLIAATPQ